MNLQMHHQVYQASSAWGHLASSNASLNHEPTKHKRTKLGEVQSKDNVTKHKRRTPTKHGHKIMKVKFLYNVQPMLLICQNTALSITKD
jgi:hypothetical protein